MKKVCYLLLMSVFMLSCSSQKKCANKPDCLADTQWKMQSFVKNGVEMTIASDVPTLGFTKKGEINGFAGCNRYFGVYAVVDCDIKLTPQGSTKAYCHESMALEEAFFSSLEEIKTYTVAGDVLKLSSADKRITMQFVKMD